MKCLKVTDNTTVFLFDNISDYETYVYLVEKDTKYYLIDTYCGPDSILPALEIARIAPDKELIVVNTHFHWDHVWGNCALQGKTIIGHDLCRKYLEHNWHKQCCDNKEYISGKVEKVLPNMTFWKKIIYQDEGIEIFHSPGHTPDSISIFDYQEKILYVGDNLEKPIIYVESPDLSTYIQTLQSYLSYDFKKIMAGHTLELTSADILETIEYLSALQNGTELHFQTEYERKIHDQNLRVINHQAMEEMYRL